MSPEQTCSMRMIHVLRLSGEELHVEVDNSCTVQQLVCEVAARLALPPTSLRLVQDACVLAQGDKVVELKSDKVTAISVRSSEYGLGAGDICETLHPVTVREHETFDSTIVSELDEGATLEVLDVGDGRRLLVGGCAQGWISYKTERNEPLVAKKVSHQSMFVVEVGLQYEVFRAVTLRAGNSVCSQAVARLAPGIRVVILEVDAVPVGARTGTGETLRSAKVVVSRGDATGAHLGIEGWLQLSDGRGNPFLRVAAGPSARAEHPGWALVTFLRSVLSWNTDGA